MRTNSYNQMVRDFVNMTDAMNRAASGRTYDYARNGGHNGEATRVARLPIDAYNTNEAFVLNAYVPGVQAQTQDPAVVLETHLSYDVRPRLWLSLDGNFWRGGTTSLNGVENPATLQENSRVGITASFPVTSHQSLKLSYGRGAYIRFGGNYQVLSAAWQYSWISGASKPSAPRTSSYSSPRQE